MMNTEEEQRLTFLENLKERIGKKTSRPLTVVVIGTPGTGKSSFINTMITSITGNYRQWTRTGVAEQGITHRAIRISREKYMHYADKSLQEYDFPDFVDIAGIHNTKDEITSELLNLLFYGIIPSDVPLAEVTENIREHGKWFTDKVYPETPECKKIDRVIFIASSKNPELPVQLMQAVSTELRRKRDIPIFGVLTNKDHQEQEEVSEDFQMLFRTTLGLSQLDYLYCTNYCDDNIKEIRERNMTHYPELDIPVLKFLMEVLDPIAECTDFRQNTGFSKKRFVEWFYIMAVHLREISSIHLLFMIIVTILIAIILALALSR